MHRRRAVVAPRTALAWLRVGLCFPLLAGCPKDSELVEIPEPPAPAYIVGMTEAPALPEPTVADPAAAAAAVVSADGPLGADQIEVHVPDASLFSGIEVVCMDGYRQRSPMKTTADSVSGVARIGGLRSAQCRLLFKGGTPATYSPVVPGTSYDCRVVGSTAVCGPKVAARPASPVASPKAPPVAAGPVAGDVLLVEVTDSPGVSGLELSCPGGYRQRQSVIPLAGPSGVAGNYGPAKFRYVPKEPCTLYFKGVKPARFDPVTAGTSLRCHLVSTTAVCAPAAPGR
jgi:hypothetical protein